MDQSNRYADLSLREADLIAGGRHILVAYKMKPKAGHGYLEAAAHFAAESSTGTNAEVSTTDEFTKGVDALVYWIDEAAEDMRIAYPLDLFDRNITDGRMMIVSFLTLAIGNNQGMGDIQHAKMIDFWVPPRALQLFDGPSKDITDLWRLLGRPVKDGGYIAGTIIKPKLGLRPEPFALAADDHHEMIARGEYILEQFGPDAAKVAFLVDGYVGGPGMVTTARRYFANQYLHYHRAGHGAVTSPSSHRGYTAYVLAKMSRLQGASGIHVGTMGYGKMEGEKDDRAIAYIIERDHYDGPVYAQDWWGMRPTTPIISGGMNALRLPGFFDNLGHGNVINTAGGGAYGHIDSPAAGARSLRQAYDCWKAGADPVDWARDHYEFARAFESFPQDADKIYPGWRQRLRLAA